MRQAALVLAAVIMIGSTAWAQAPGTLDRPSTWEAGAFGGFLTGGEIFSGDVNLEPVTVSNDTGWLAGARVGKDWEFTGLEFDLAGVFYDETVEADPAAGLAGTGDASMFLGDLRGLLYFLGNDLADGRIRPFVGAGPGVAHYMGDSDLTDGETMFDVSLDAGIKFLLGDSGNPVLRVDYQWYFFVSGGDLRDNFWRHGLTAGISWMF